MLSAATVIHGVVLANNLPTLSQFNDEIKARRTDYLNWIVDVFGAQEASWEPQDGRRWALNHARLRLSKDTTKANQFFESFPASKKDIDIYLIKFLLSYLEFKDNPQLSAPAKERLEKVLKPWPYNKHQLTKQAFWPPAFTENHDLMYLTLALFAKQIRGEDASVQINAIKEFIALRLERGFVEWNSQCYQYHLSNSLFILAQYSPDKAIKQGAAALLDIMLAERVTLGVQGYLGGPSLRCRTADVTHSLTARKVAYLSDGRYDGFLPVVWLATGLGEPRFDFKNSRDPELQPAGPLIASGNEPRLKQDEGMCFACTDYIPNPVIMELAEEARMRSELIYVGQRHIGWPAFDELWETQKWKPGVLYYYNTPHVSMGSIHSDGWLHQARYNSVLFGADPSMAIRVEKIIPGEKPHKRRREARGRVVQHRNWMLSQGTLFEDGGIKPVKLGAWNIYQVGKGLCAEMDLGDDYHVLQVSDLDKYASAKEFADALHIPARAGDTVTGKTVNGDVVEVNLANMEIKINGTGRVHPNEMLHDSPILRSDYMSGRVTVKSQNRQVVYDASQLKLRPQIKLPETEPGQFIWGNPREKGKPAAVRVTRAAVGMSPEKESKLASLSIHLAQNANSDIRVGLYAGGSLKKGPHAEQPARLLVDFGKTPRGKKGWITMTPPEDTMIPANTPLWLVWKAGDGKVSVTFNENSARMPMGLQGLRGRWESKAIPQANGKVFPDLWPDDPKGSFDNYYFSCYLTLENH